MTRRPGPRPGRGRPVSRLPCCRLRPGRTGASLVEGGGRFPKPASGDLFSGGARNFHFFDTLDFSNHLPDQEVHIFEIDVNNLEAFRDLTQKLAVVLPGQKITSGNPQRSAR